jgi:hypothetical protein
MKQAQQNKHNLPLTKTAKILSLLGLIMSIGYTPIAFANPPEPGSQQDPLPTAQQQLLQIVKSVRQLYSTSGTVDPLANMPTAANCGAIGQQSCTYVAAGMFPADALNTGNPATATAARTPWGQNTNIAVSAAQRNVLNDSFVVTFNNIPTTACIQILTTMAGQDRDTGMWRAEGAPAGAAAARNPGANLATGTPLAASNTGCPAGVNGQARFYFTLKNS